MRAKLVNENWNPQFEAIQQPFTNNLRNQSNTGPYVLNRAQYEDADKKDRRTNYGLLSTGKNGEFVYVVAANLMNKRINIFEYLSMDDLKNGFYQKRFYGEGPRTDFTDDKICKTKKEMNTYIYSLLNKYPDFYVTHSRIYNVPDYLERKKNKL